MGIGASTNAKVHLALLKVAAKRWSQKRIAGDGEFVMGTHYFEWFVFLVDQTVDEGVSIFEGEFFSFPVASGETTKDIARRCLDYS